MRRIIELEAKLTQTEDKLSNTIDDFTQSYARLEAENERQKDVIHTVIVKEAKLQEKLTRDINELARVNEDNKRLQAKLTHYRWLSINSNLEGDG